MKNLCLYNVHVPPKEGFEVYVRFPSLGIKVCLDF